MSEIDKDMGRTTDASGVIMDGPFNAEGPGPQPAPKPGVHQPDAPVTAVVLTSGVQLQVLSDPYALATRLGDMVEMEMVTFNVIDTKQSTRKVYVTRAHVEAVMPVPLNHAELWEIRDKAMAEQRGQESAERLRTGQFGQKPRIVT